MRHFLLVVLANFVFNGLFCQTTDSAVVMDSNTVVAAVVVDTVEIVEAVEAANTETGKPVSPYKVSILKDGAITLGGIGLTALGLHLIENKRGITEAELATRTRESLPFFDRGNAGYYSVKADRDSYIPFHASFVMPMVVGLLNRNERHHFGQVMFLYVETMAITGAMFTMATGNVYRSRPYVYGELAPKDYRMQKHSHRSFYAGHTAATAAASFFTAKVFHDFNPDSKLKPVIWGVAAAMPAVVGYLRYKAGMHFLSDNILGYVIGAGTGILVPHLHKKKMMNNVSITPTFGFGQQGLAVTYKFK